MSILPDHQPGQPDDQHDITPPDLLDLLDDISATLDRIEQHLAAWRRPLLISKRRARRPLHCARTASR